MLESSISGNKIIFLIWQLKTYFLKYFPNLSLKVRQTAAQYTTKFCQTYETYQHLNRPLFFKTVQPLGTITSLLIPSLSTSDFKGIKSLSAARLDVSTDLSSINFFSSLIQQVKYFFGLIFKMTIWFWIKTQHFIIHSTEIFFYTNFPFFFPLESLILFVQGLSQAHRRKSLGRAELKLSPKFCFIKKLTIDISPFVFTYFIICLQNKKNYNYDFENSHISV